MTRTRPFTELSARINADPASKARVAQYKQAMLDAVKVAEVLDATPSEVSRIEREEDAYLATLRAYIEDLGGVLELRAVFPTGSVVLAPTPAPTSETSANGTDPARASRVGAQSVEMGEADPVTPSPRRG